MSPAKKEFDCVEFKRNAQAAIYEKIKGLSPEQEIEFFRRAAQESPLGSRWARIKAAADRPSRRAG